MSGVFWVYAALVGCGGDGGFAAITRVDDGILTDVTDLRGLVFAADGRIYGSGFTDVNPVDRQTAVVRTTADGALDPTFGDGGLVLLNLAQGDEESLAIVELEGGDVVVLANVSDEQGGDPIPDIDGGDPVPRPNGQDVVLVRLDAQGELRTDFGDGGILRVTFGWEAADDASWPVPTYTASNAEATRFSGPGFPMDEAWDLDVDRSGASERLVVFGLGSAARVASGAQRIDADRYVVRLNADGTPDASFHGGEAFTFHSEGALNDNARRGLVEADGTIVSVGYTNYGVGLDNHVIVLRLLPSGSPDPGFGFGFMPARAGAARFNPYVVDGGASEAYGVTQLSDGTYVATGYGFATASNTPSSLGYETTVAQDAVFFGFTESGLSSGFGRDGELCIQSEALELASTEDRGRAVVALPDDRTVHAGRFGGDPALFVVRPNGTLDRSVGDRGRIVYAGTGLASNFFAVAVSPDGTRIAAATDADPDGVLLAILEVGTE